MSGFLSILFILGLAKPPSIIVEDVCGCLTIEDLEVMTVIIEDETP